MGDVIHGNPIPKPAKVAQTVAGPFGRGRMEAVTAKKAFVEAIRPVQIIRGIEDLPQKEEFTCRGAFACLDKVLSKQYPSWGSPYQLLDRPHPQWESQYHLQGNQYPQSCPFEFNPESCPDVIRLRGELRAITCGIG